MLRDFHELWPEKFRNKTNGVTPRRFIALANPRPRARSSTSTIGERLDHATWSELRALEPLADDAGFRPTWRAVKRANKDGWPRSSGSAPASRSTRESLFDVQVKRIHEYKRQHLNVLHVITLVPPPARGTRERELAPRTFIFGGKAAPGYRMAKLIIKLINGVAEVVNARSRACAAGCKVVFFPNFNVKNGAARSIRPPICPSRSRPPARRPRAPAT